MHVEREFVDTALFGIDAIRLLLYNTAFSIIIVASC